MARQIIKKYELFSSLSPMANETKSIIIGSKYVSKPSTFIGTSVLERIWAMRAMPLIAPSKMSR